MTVAPLPDRAKQRPVRTKDYTMMMKVMVLTVGVMRKMAMQTTEKKMTWHFVDRALRLACAYVSLFKVTEPPLGTWRGIWDMCHLHRRYAKEQVF